MRSLVKQIIINNRWQCSFQSAWLINNDMRKQPEKGNHHTEIQKKMRYLYYHYSSTDYENKKYLLTSYFGRNLPASPFIPPSLSIWNSRVSLSQCRRNSTGVPKEYHARFTDNFANVFVGYFSLVYQTRLYQNCC